MRTSVRKRQLATCLSLCCILYAFAGRGVHAGARLGFKLVRNYLIVIPVRVNGQGPFEFLLDTGTNSTLITPQLAGRLGLRPTDHIPLITLSGTEIVPRAALDSLALGATSTKHLEVIFDDLSGIRLVDSKIHGVLGQNFLSRFNYLIDYRERYVEFEEDGELGRRFTGATLALELDEGKALIHSEATAPHRESLRLVLDSGASHLVVFPPASFRLRLEVEHRESFLSTTDATRDPVKLGLLGELLVGTERIRDLPAALILPRAAVERRNEDGLLPTSLFHTIFFQNDRHTVILNPRAERKP